MTGILAGTSIPARRTIVRAKITTRANGSNAHAHGKVVTFDACKLWAGRDTLVLTIAKETAAVTFQGTNDIKIESIIWIVVGRESRGRVFICISSLAKLAN
jgi:hypothetical protein